jgi:hypothetical protein
MIAASDDAAMPDTAFYAAIADCRCFSFSISAITPLLAAIFSRHADFSVSVTAFVITDIFAFG